MLRLRCCAVLLAAAVLVASPAGADPLRIHEIQYTGDPLGASPFDGQIVDCVGGVVTHKFPGSRPRVILQDPNPPGDPKYADGWAGIQVKDWTGAGDPLTHDLFDAVGVGDWVSLTNVRVEENRGTTFLQYQSDNGAAFAVVSPGGGLPACTLVTAGAIAAPIQDASGDWYVADHGAEMFESMLLTIEGVTVTEMGLGKASDNYNLRCGDDDVWASDYMNADRGGVYHPYVAVGQEFDSVSGVLEQYTKLADGFDYYQLLTRQTADLVVPEPASLIILLAAVAVMKTPRR